MWQGTDGRGGVEEPEHAQTSQAREPGDPIGFRWATWLVHRTTERSANVTDGTADMNAHRKSDEPVVPATPANNGAAEAPAESAEESPVSPARTGSQEERRAARLAPDAEPDQTQVIRTVRRARSCPLRQHAQIHGLVASRQRRLFDRSFLQLEEDGGSWSRRCNLARI